MREGSTMVPNASFETQGKVKNETVKCIGGHTFTDLGQGVLMNVWYLGPTLVT